jgi:hypothetical protein
MAKRLKKRSKTPRADKPYSIRLPNDLRKQLERFAAEHRKNGHGKKGWNLSQEIIARLNSSIHEPLDEPKMHALCHLFAETAYAVSGSYVPDEKGGYRPAFDWRSDPFMFESFKLTVAQLLDALRPPGEIKSPISNLEELATADRWSQSIARSFTSPEERARDTFAFIWQKYQSAQPLSGDELKGAMVHRRFDDISLHNRMSAARQILSLSNTGDDK